MRCENCGHLNPLHSEFLTFCDSCKKKLTSNYRDWSKLHDGKNFEAYKKEVCERVEEPETAELSVSLNPLVG